LMQRVRFDDGQRGNSVKQAAEDDGAFSAKAVAHVAKNGRSEEHAEKAGAEYGAHHRAIQMPLANDHWRGIGCSCQRVTIGEHHQEREEDDPEAEQADSLFVHQVRDVDCLWLWHPLPFGLLRHGVHVAIWVRPVFLTD